MQGLGSMTSNLISSLQTYFGFSNFRPGQGESIQNLLDNQHTLVVMPTGSGKSLIFQLAALQLVTPTRPMLVFLWALRWGVTA